MSMKNVLSLHKPDMPFAAVARLAFAHALDRMSKVVAPKTTVPILTAVKLESRGEQLTITGTDLDIEIKIALPVASDSTDMTAIIELAKLRQFLKLAAGDFIRITSSEDGERATILCGASSMEIDVFDPANWPEEPVKFEKKGFSHFDISPGTFWSGVDSVLPAVSSEATRFYLNGAFMEKVDAGIRLVATDGHRMHYRDLVLPSRTKFAGNCILPTNLLAALKACIQPKSYGQHLRVSLSQQDPPNVRFQLADMVITAKTIDGTFPDYRRVMPGQIDTVVTAQGDALMRFINASTDAKVIRLTFFPDACLAEVKIDEAIRRTEIECSIEGDGMTVGFSLAYLKAAIGEASPSGGKVKFHLFSPESPVNITGTDKPFMCTLMPMRV